MKLLVLSDIHGNWQALQAVLAAETDFDAVAFCGDVIDYGPNPKECLAWLRENAHHLVRGNHDNAHAFDLDCRCMPPFRACSSATRTWHRSLLTDQDRRFLANMPTLHWFEEAGTHFRLSHATPQGDLFEYLPMEAWGDRVSEIDGDFVLLGHTHVQGMRSFGRTTVVNPGSVGLVRGTHDRDEPRHRLPHSPHAGDGLLRRRRRRSHRIKAHSIRRLADDLAFAAVATGASDHR
jgi:putative phosphoesterase